MAALSFHTISQATSGGGGALIAFANARSTFTFTKLVFSNNTAAVCRGFDRQMNGSLLYPPCVTLELITVSCIQSFSAYETSLSEIFS
jgi:hypothetical protein